MKWSAVKSRECPFARSIQAEIGKAPRLRPSRGYFTRRGEGEKVTLKVPPGAKILVYK